VYFNVNFNVFFKLIKLHLLVSELYIYQNARCNDKKKKLCMCLVTQIWCVICLVFISITVRLQTKTAVVFKYIFLPSVQPLLKVFFAPINTSRVKCKLFKMCPDKHAGSHE